MRRLLPLAVVFVLTACTPGQFLRYVDAKLSGDPTRSAQADIAAESYLAQRAQLTAGRPCPDWYDWAVEAGFRPDQWSVVSRLMAAESGCTPTAYNSSGATGLMQVLKSWAGSCGGVPADLFDPAFNLACAHHVYEAQGYSAWSTF
jgi:Lysozyme like domain